MTNPQTTDGDDDCITSFTQALRKVEREFAQPADGNQAAVSDSPADMRRISASLSYNSPAPEPSAKHLLLSAAGQIERLRAELAGFPNATAMRQCMVDTADENKSLRADLERVKAELERLKSCDMAHKLEELRQELSSEQRLRERFQVGYEGALRELAYAREEMGRVKEALRVIIGPNGFYVEKLTSDAHAYFRSMLGEKAGG